MRIHITGASGSGVTTLGAALAKECGFLHLDADDYYWLPTDSPFRHKRPRPERLALLTADLERAADTVLTGSIVGWGRDIEDSFDLVVFLYLPADIRLERLRRCEMEKYGRVDPAFLEWAAQYDAGPPEGRSLGLHNTWLAQRSCPVLRLELNETVAERVAAVQQALSGISCQGD